MEHGKQPKLETIGNSRFAVVVVEDENLRSK